MFVEQKLPMSASCEICELSSMFVISVYNVILILTTAVASTTSTVSALPSPPPGFSKNTPLSGHTLHDGSTAGGVTVAAVGTGSGNQTVTSANPVNPMLLVNSKG